MQKTIQHIEQTCCQCHSEAPEAQQAHGYRWPTSVIKFRPVESNGNNQVLMQQQFKSFILLAV